MRSMLALLLGMTLAVWFAVAVAAGVAAMGTFTMLPSLDLTLAEYAALPAEDHGRMAAGIVMQRIFRMVDVVQWVCAPLAVALSVALAIGAGRCLLRSARLAAVLLAAVLFATYGLALAPRMNASLEAYRDAARRGEVDDATAHRARFDEMHPMADGLLRANIFILLAAIGLLAADAAPPQRRTST
jgi:hypothetical protein